MYTGNVIMTLKVTVQTTGRAVCLAVKFFTIKGLGSNFTDDAQNKCMNANM